MSGEDPVPELQMAEIRDTERGKREREGEKEREKERGGERKRQALMSSPLRALSPFMRVPPS